MYIYNYIYIYICIRNPGRRDSGVQSSFRTAPTAGLSVADISYSGFRLGASLMNWVFFTVGCSGRGVQWMGVVLCNTTAYNLI